MPYKLDLNPHTAAHREISTLEATRLLLMDMGVDLSVTESLREYQVMGNVAAKLQLGPRRVSPKHS